MAQRDRIYPDAGYIPTAPAPPGSYYSVKDLNQMPPPATYQQRRRGRSPCCCCFLWLCSIFTILIVALGIAVLVFWLVVRPKAPNFDVQAVNLNATTFSLPPPYNVNITYNITAGNPNKHVGFYYSDISVFVQANGNDVASGRVDDFYQGHRNTTYINGEIGQSNVTIPSSTITAITNNPSNAPFYAQVDLKAKLKIGSLKIGKIKVKVECNINLDLTSQNQLKSRHCKVKW